MRRYLTAFAKRVLPRTMVSRLSHWRVRQASQRSARKNQNRSATEVFSEIYADNVWGGPKGQFYSGSGTYGPAAQSYIEMVNAFIDQYGVRSVVDIGCGDFQIGQMIRCADYTGIDVVPAVVERNQQSFGASGRRFLCMDATGDDELPTADLCLVRQVFQHLSNDQILRALGNLRRFTHVIVTEHQPSEAGFVAFNADKVHGHDTRVHAGSGVYLDRPPFSLEISCLLDCQAGDASENGRIRSYRVTLPA